MPATLTKIGNKGKKSIEIVETLSARVCACACAISEGSDSFYPGSQIDLFSERNHSIFYITVSIKLWFSIRLSYLLKETLTLGQFVPLHQKHN